jgi:uncharacterized membrane protein YdjX (TVP38/TMEM64 family)
VSDASRNGRPLVSGRVVAGVVLVLLMVAGVAVMRLWPHQAIAAAEHLMTGVRGLGTAGLLAFALLQAFIAVSGVLPASLLGVAAGAFYGLVPGFLLAAVSTLAGALLAFWLSRSIFRPAVERMMRRRPRLRDLDTSLAGDGWKLVCLLRISPVMPFAATSYVLGMSSIGLRDYAIGTLASLPALAGYVFVGTLADAELAAWAHGAGPLQWALLAVGIVATLLLTLRIGQIAVRVARAPVPLAAPDGEGEAPTSP